MRTKRQDQFYLEQIAKQFRKHIFKMRSALRRWLRVVDATDKIFLSDVLWISLTRRLQRSLCWNSFLCLFTYLHFRSVIWASASGSFNLEITTAVDYSAELGLRNIRSVHKLSCWYINFKRALWIMHKNAKTFSIGLLSAIVGSGKQIFFGFAWALGSTMILWMKIQGCTYPVICWL